MNTNIFYFKNIFVIYITIKSFMSVDFVRMFGINSTSRSKNLCK